MASEFVVKNGLIVSGTSNVVGNQVISGSLVQGTGSVATNFYGHAQGRDTRADGEYSHTEGWSTSASAQFAHAEGRFTHAAGQGTHAEGSYTYSEGVASHAEGLSTSASANYSHAEGEYSRATGQSSHAEGYATVASSSYSHAEGAFTSASGDYSHAEGGSTRATAAGAHAEGSGSIATGISSHAEGLFTSASGIYSHAEGGHTRATVGSSHAEGTGSVTTGIASHAEGAGTVAAGLASHAEGASSIASGSYSHAEGQSTLSLGLYSHAEGRITSASGDYSHAEGTASKATGVASHAEGLDTLASGIGSHAEGLGTTASANYQHVEGRYNATSSTAIWIVGDGLSNTDKKNLVTAFRDHLVISGSQSITGSFNSISSSVNVVFGRLNVTSGSIHMNSSSIGTNIFGTSSWADQLSRGPVFMTGSAPAQVPSGGLWWNTNDNFLYVQTAAPSGSTWTSVVNQTVPFASASRTVVSQITPSTYGGTMIISENRLFYLNGTEGNLNYNRGTGTTSGNNFPGVLNMRPINFPNETTATIVSASTFGQSAFALFNNGNLYTWGRNNYGQLGLGDTTDRLLPVLSSTSVADAYWDASQYHRSMDTTHFFMKKTDGKVYFTGYNAFGQSGLGSGANRSSWTLSYDPTSIVYSSFGAVRRVWPLGGYTGASVLETVTGKVFTCGYNGQGQLGINNTTNPNIWIGLNNWNPLSGTGSIQEVLFGGGDALGPIEQCNLCMLFDNGTDSAIRMAGANGWGTNGQGVVGGANQISAVSPVGFSGRVSKIARSGNVAGSIWALKTDGTLWNWGYNGNGQLGRGNTTDSGTPTQITTGVLDILYPKGASYYAGYVSSSPIIRKADGYYRCGVNTVGQLADGTTTSRTTLTKMLFPGGIILTTVGSVGTNSENLTFYAVDTQNRFWVWGYNSYSAIDAINTAGGVVATPVQMSPGALMR